MHGCHERTSIGTRGPARVALYTRRRFLKSMAVATAAIAGVVTGLGGVLGACDGADRPSNTTATVHPGETTTTVTTPTSTAAPTSTTAVTGPETGRDVKIGLVSAMTGSLALFGKADDWWTALAMEALGERLVCGDGRLHRLVIVRRDSESDAGSAAKAAAGLILDARVDLVLCSGGTSLVDAVAAQAEALVCPCLCSFVQYPPFGSGRDLPSEKPFTWAFAHAVGLDDIIANFVAMWGRMDTNKKVGLAFADDLTGQTWTDPEAGLPSVAASLGFEFVLPGLRPLSTLDHTPYISAFRKDGCEICCGAFSASEFADFWRQCLEQEYQPKIMTVAEGLVLPHAVEAVGPAARNVTAECLWQPEWPYRDSMTGMTCRELANDYMAKTGDQWTAAIAQYAKFEWAVDVLRRVTDLDSRRDILREVERTDLETCLGPIDLTARVDASGVWTRRPAKNVYKAPVGSAQWVQGEAFGFEPRLITAVGAPRLSVTGDLRPIAYES